MTRPRPALAVLAAATITAALLPWTVPSAAAVPRGQPAGPTPTLTGPTGPTGPTATATDVPLSPGDAGTEGDAADSRSTATPLEVILRGMSPAVLPQRGSVFLSGTVQNRSTEVWSDVNLLPFLGNGPIQTRAALDQAADSDPTTEVGERITDPGSFAGVGDLEPGESAAFRIQVPATSLPRSQPGVYWIGVHALGTNTDGRDTTADGRARTFIANVAAGQPTTEVSVVVPVREQVRRAPDGELLDVPAWTALFESGRLRRVLDFAAAGPGLTNLLVDPAVADAAESLTRGNPAWSLGVPVDDAPAASQSEDPAEPDADRLAAQRWLTLLRDLGRRETLLGLGYGDPDVAALARRSPTLLSSARQLAEQTFDRLELSAIPTVASPDGAADQDSFQRLPERSLVLVSDQGDSRTQVRWRTTSGQEMLFTDQRVSSGGPAPTTPLTALALRQRILADAALRGADGVRGPMVVQLPPTWDPGTDWAEADFFAGLNQPWLRLVPVPVSSGPLADTLSTVPVFTAPLPYPRSARQAELGPANVDAARRLAATGRIFGAVLRTENTLTRDLVGQALQATSVHARADRAAAARAVRAALARQDLILDRIQISGTDFVTLSGGSGTIAVTVVNGLDVPVQVTVASRRVRGVTVSVPKTLEMAPGERSVVRLEASTNRVVVRRIELSPATPEGRPLGNGLTVTLRTSQVGAAIWVVLAGGVFLVAALILRRLRYGRFRRRDPDRPSTTDDDR